MWWRCSTGIDAANLSRTDPTTRPPAARSLLWPTLVAGLVVALLCGLGTWQLMRLDWKSALIAAATARLAGAPSALPDDLTDPEELDWRHVEVQGHLLDGGVLYRSGSSPSGRAGLRALAPLQPSGRQAVLLVDLGWLPLDRKDAPLALPSGAIRVEGVLRAPEPPTWLTPDNDPAGNAWKWLDLPAMAAALEVPALAPVLLRAERIDIVDRPALAELERGPVVLDLDNDHLHYAVTWFALAVGMAVIYLLFVSRHRRRKGMP
jgi:surfeit locus 1 family protein